MRIFKNLPLREFSRFKIGGPAREIVIVENRKELLSAMNGEFLVFGHGTNVLFPDQGLEKRVIFFKGGEFHVDGTWIVADAGVELSKIIEAALNNGLSGLENLAGIPGTLGGAIYGNAGAFGSEIGSVVSEVEVWKNGEPVRMRSPWFGYRDSVFKREGGVILRAWLKLKRGTGREREIALERIKLRKTKHPSDNVPCAGSFFKNIVLADGRKIPAGRLLEEVGAKGMKIGGAGVFHGHANFIINLGNATASDVLRLASILKERVRKKFGIELQEEVIIVEDP